MLSLVREYEEKDVLKIVYTSNTYIRFITPTIRKKVGLCGDGTWDKIQDLVVYEIDNRRDKAIISLYIGPATEDNRVKWIE